MISDIPKDFFAIASAVQIYSPAQYSVGSLIRTLPGYPMGTGHASDPFGMETALSFDVYRELFCRPTPQSALHSDPHALRDHVAALSHANVGSGAWEEGWEIIRLHDNGTIAVRKIDLTFWTSRENVRPASELGPGTACAVRIPKEMRYLLPGFYMAIGNQDLPISPLSNGIRESYPNIVRLYWHLTAETSALYMHLVTECLNSRHIAFRTKVLSHPANYVRADSGVLYIESTSLDVVLDALGALYRQIRSGLREDVPMFTRPIAPGLSLAEDPGNGESFGQSRCKLVSRALWRCYVSGFTDVGKRADEIAKEFEQHNIDPRFPHLRTGSNDYSLSVIEKKVTS